MIAFFVGILVTAIVLLGAIRLMDKDGDVIDFELVIMMATAPAVVEWLASIMVNFIGLEGISFVIGQLLSVVTIFVLAKNSLEWQSSKAVYLSIIYLLTKLSFVFLMLSYI